MEDVRNGVGGWGEDTQGRVMKKQWGEWRQTRGGGEQQGTVEGRDKIY